MSLAGIRQFGFWVASQVEAPFGWAIFGLGSILARILLPSHFFLSGIPYNLAYKTRIL
jgi:hypothetical protein